MNADTADWRGFGKFVIYKIRENPLNLCSSVSYFLRVL